MNTAVIPSALCEALKVQRCSDDDIPRVWTALVFVGLTSPDDWTTDFIKEEDFKSAGLSLLLSRKLLAALKTASASGAQEASRVPPQLPHEGDGFRLLPPDKDQPAPSASYGVSPESPVLVPTQDAQADERNSMEQEQVAST